MSLVVIIISVLINTAIIILIITIAGSIFPERAWAQGSLLVW